MDNPKHLYEYWIKYYEVELYKYLDKNPENTELDYINNILKIFDKAENTIDYDINNLEYVYGIKKTDNEYNERILKLTENKNIVNDVKRFLEVKKNRITPSKQPKQKKEAKPTLYQKYILLYETGYIDVLVSKYYNNQSLQNEIISFILECNIDTARKILSRTYTKGDRTINPTFDELMDKLKNK